MVSLQKKYSVNMVALANDVNKYIKPKARENGDFEFARACRLGPPGG